MSTSRDPSVPGATYRLQLHEGFTLDDAAGIADYVTELGVTHIYCSPIFQATPHSVHGYDAVDHAVVSADLGGRAAYDRLLAVAPVVLDIVPNHMAVNDQGNAQWWDVLKHGQQSRYAEWFDIEWSAPASPGQIFLPVLGRQLEEVLAAGELSFDDRNGEPVLRYYDAIYPLAPGTSGASVAEALGQQHYVLAHWRQAASLNYRRFFDVTSLAGLRVENDSVFTRTHTLLASHFDRSVDNYVPPPHGLGLRIDHPDGMADPAQYFARLHELTGGGWVVVEKILEPGEALERSWPVAGTTGYDALHDVNGVFVHPDGQRPLSALHDEVTQQSQPWRELVHDAKLQVLDQLFVAELDRLSRVPTRDNYERTQLRAALRELIACFPVYRSYLQTAVEPRPADIEVIERARDEASARRPALEVVLWRLVDEITDVAVPSELRTRLQQTTGPVMAKGVEDTSFYRYHRLISLNEVGGDPGAFGLSLQEFYEACTARQSSWPHSQTTLSTHDTKRSEDVRARISLLAQCPDQWAALVRGWYARNARHWAVEPDRPIEYLLYQTLVGAWPLSLERAQAYVDKASREAKLRTSWTERDDEYDAALQSFVAALYADEAFIASVEAFVATLLAPGRVASMAQKLVQLTMPGVPDIYQGCELWDLSLVDPDNRRPVDYGLRRRLLGELSTLTAREVMGRPDEGLPKMLVVHRALALRAKVPAAFDSGACQPLIVTGTGRDSVIAFARGDGAVTIVPRFALRPLLAGDAVVTLPAGEWHDEFTGQQVSGDIDVAQLLTDFPVSLLSRPQQVVAIWAPRAAAAEIEIDGRRTPLLARDGGWYEVELDIEPGTDYAFALDGAAETLPDPRSGWQPNGVDGPSRWVDHSAYRWGDAGFRPRAWQEAVVYELHIGTFTPLGSFDSAIERLDHLAALGVTHLEVLPVAQFSGSCGWGYDGVDLWAVHHAYGGPAAFKRFIDACHQRGLAVLLDVVYNHLGPAGNYLTRFGPYFTGRYGTPWGEAVNYDDIESHEVREFVIGNALMWLRDYHLDGLRLDAVHAIHDCSPVHVLAELGERVAALAARSGREIVLVAESDLNDPRIIRDRDADGFGMTAQWSDDLHHALHSVLTREVAGYYEDFGTVADLAKAMTDGFVYDGRHSAHRGRPHGATLGGLPAYRLVCCLQNHDQVGNRAQGERSSALMSDGLLCVGAALVLLGPWVPMLFQGEEWGASTPFQYFTAHEELTLADAVRRGRRAEFAAFGWLPEDVPDPQDRATFERSKLDWSEVIAPGHAALLTWHRDLLAMRRDHPDLGGGAWPTVRFDEAARWLVMERGTWLVYCNLSPEPVRLPATGRIELASAAATLADAALLLPGESVAVVRTTR